jgi:hypothetical protein
VLGASTGPIALGSGTGSSVPGSPDTGAGGNAPVNYLLLALSGLVAITGAGVLIQRKRTRTDN